jgi:hypothetical protein
MGLPPPPSCAGDDGLTSPQNDFAGSWSKTAAAGLWAFSVDRSRFKVQEFKGSRFEP